ncbi:MAG: type IV pilus twitching motility protein PilT [Halanaerobiales bacterium]|nr:type IV pilus twitching motility protein PilT [Halanaerobiales bacterium]
MEMEQLFTNVVDRDGVSDLHLTVKSKPIIRYNGNLQIYQEYPRELEVEDLEEITKEMLSDDLYKQFQEKGEVDFSYSVPGVSRFRVNIYRQRGSIGIAMRVIPQEIPTVDELGYPNTLKKLALMRMGLVLCTGPTGSGKSTTLAAMINEINEKKAKHILTLEDPIEYLHSHRNCIVHQREVGVDTKSFANGLRSALREDPDVILVGEMRDLDTISIALEAAETGHLVLATLHTNSAPATIDRIIDVFPPHQQEQVRIQLASTLNGVISQQLLPRADRSGRVGAVGILIGTPAVKNVIREGESHQLKSIMQTGSKYGMVVRDNYLLDLFNQGTISKDILLRRADNRKYVEKRLSREASY